MIAKRYSGSNGKRVQNNSTQVSEEVLQTIVVAENADEEKIACDVCRYLDDYEDDEIVICGLCQVAVHQTCYGGELLSKSI